MSSGQRFEDGVRDQGAAALPVCIKVPNDRAASGAQRRGSLWLDFMGILPGGRAVTGDAKWVGTERRITRSLLRPEQRGHADRAHEAGALVVVIVGWLDGSQARVSVVPWVDLRAEGQDVTAWLCSDWCARLLEVGDASEQG